MYYQLDTRDLSAETALTLFRKVFQWAAEKGDRFEIISQTGLYDDRKQLDALLALGEVTAPPPVGDSLGRFFARMFDKDSVSIRGRPNAAFVGAITGSTAPPRAISGHECPVDSITIYRGEKPFYACYDYGTVQTIADGESDVMEIKKQLTDLGLGPERLIPLSEKSGPDGG